MDLVGLVIFLSALALCNADSPIQCNMTLHEVPSCRDPCPPERTCQNYLDPEPPCAPPPGPCTYKCVCDDGYARNQYGGYCVTLDQCAKCPGYSQYFSCDGPYSETCAGSCHCATGYERDSNNVCVSTTPPLVTEKILPTPPVGIPAQPVNGGPTAIEECCGGGPGFKQPPPICNETLYETLGCVYGCPPERTCQNRHWPPIPCAPPSYPCTEKCICGDGYVRNQEGGTCVTLEQCDSPIQCNMTLHEVASCRDPCPPERTCQNYLDAEPPCAPPPGPCTYKCVCDDGYVRNQYGGYCVTLDQCGKCPGYSQYFSCDGPYSETCAGSCHCAAGYERDSNNACVSTTPPPVTEKIVPPPPVEIPVQPVNGGPTAIEECCGGGPVFNQPPPICNETLHETLGCVYGCPPEQTCQNRNWPPFPCAPPSFPCTEKCLCGDGYVRNQEGGTCVTLEQCDRCGENEYFECDGEYDEQCVGQCYCISQHTRDINDKCVYVDAAVPPEDFGPPAPEPVYCEEPEA